MTKKFLNNIDLNGTLTIAGSGGTNGYFLSTNGSGVISWAAATGALGYIGSTQTTASAATTISLGLASVSTSPGGAVSFIGGATTNATGTGGNVTITGGAATTGTNTTTGGNVIISGGASNTSSGVGGYVQINAGLGSGPSNSGDSNIYIGDLARTTRITIGQSTNTVSFPGKISFDGGSGYNLLTSINAPGVLSVDNSSLQMNFNANQALYASGAFEYNTNIFRGFQTSTGAGRVPVIHSVFSLANSTSSTNTTQSVFAAANDVLSSLEAARLYRFKAQYYSSFTYSSGFSGAININFAFSQTPTAIKYSFKTYPQTAGTTVTQQGASSVATATTIVPSQSASGTWITEIEGYFTTHATLVSTFTPQFICTATTNSSAIMTAGSWLEVEKLGTSTQTLIAGNWA
jgi:hypothetical protein